MNIISSKRLHFQKLEYYNDPLTNESHSRVIDEITVEADPRPQAVPDWVRDEDLFQLCVADEAISEIQIVKQPAKTTPLVNTNSKWKDKSVKAAKFVDTRTGEVEGAPVATELTQAAPKVGGDWPSNKPNPNSNGLLG